MRPPSPEAEAWAASGALGLTGGADGPALVAPDGIVSRIVEMGERLDVDALALVGERAAALGLVRGGPVSCGGSARLLRAADAWVAVNLARADDLDSVPAWLEFEEPIGSDPADVWATVAAMAAGRPAADLVGRATMLGLPVAGVGEVAAASSSAALGGLPLEATPLRPPTGAARSTATDDLLVVDLSSLWAGPLCARLLADRGARVVKIESTARPDGARRGPAAFYDRLHAGTESVALDLDTGAGRVALRRLLERADVVVEASRSRALRAWGVEAGEVVAGGRCRAWVAITGFGRDVNRVAFGDDAAAAGGLVAWDERNPSFAADAVADPLTGLVAAAGVDAALRAGGSWLLDVPMAGVAAAVAGPDRCSRWLPDDRLVAAPPRALVAGGVAPALGVDNERVGAELGVPLP